MKLNRVGDIRRDSERPDEFASTLQSQIWSCALRSIFEDQARDPTSGAEFVGDFAPLSLAQRRLWIVDQLGKTLYSYGPDAQQLGPLVPARGQDEVGRRDELVLGRQPAGQPGTSGDRRRRTRRRGAPGVGAERAGDCPEPRPRRRA